jgi:hypothetical protein
MKLHEWLPKIDEWIAQSGLSVEESDRVHERLFRLIRIHETWGGEINSLGNIRLLDCCGMYLGYIDTHSCRIILTSRGESHNGGPIT